VDVYILHLLVVDHQLTDTAGCQRLQRCCKTLKVSITWNAADVQAASITKHVINYCCCSRHSRFTDFDIVDVQNNAATRTTCVDNSKFIRLPPANGRIRNTKKDKKYKHRNNNQTHIHTRLQVALKVCSSIKYKKVFVTICLHEN